MTEGEEDHFVVYQFIFAMKNPRFVALMKVEEEEVVEGVVSPSELFGEGSHAWNHFFRCTWQFRFSDDGIFEGAQDLEALPNTVYTCTSLLCSASDWKSFASLERILPSTPTASRSSSAAAGGSEDLPSLLVPEPWMEYPAMWEFLREEVTPKVTVPGVQTTFSAALPPMNLHACVPRKLWKHWFGEGQRWEAMMMRKGEGASA